MEGIEVPDRDVGTLLVVVGAFVAAVGTVLPWVTTDYVGADISISGLSVPIVIPIASGATLVISACACVLLATLAPRRFGPAVVLGNLAALFVIVGGSFVLAPGSVAGGSVGVDLTTPAATVGIGPYVTVLGGVGALVGSLLWYATPDPDVGSDSTGGRPTIGRNRG